MEKEAYSILLSVKQRQRVIGHYSLTGDIPTVKKNVEWLLESSHFLYGDINVKVRYQTCRKQFLSSVHFRIRLSIFKSHLQIVLSKTLFKQYGSTFPKLKLILVLLLVWPLRDRFPCPQCS